jgi:hypothetical protein
VFCLLSGWLGVTMTSADTEVINAGGAASASQSLAAVATKAWQASLRLSAYQSRRASVQRPAPPWR